MVILKTKSNPALPASTLIEVVISLLIMAVVFGIAMNIFVKVAGSGYTFTKIRALQQLKSEAILTLSSHQYKQEVKEFNGFTINKTIQPYPTNANLIQLTITANDADGREIGVQKHLALVED
jgi:Tfp pilus assembly major pilin PilA